MKTESFALERLDLQYQRTTLTMLGKHSALLQPLLTIPKNLDDDALKAT
jgi:hypothetical protein